MPKLSADKIKARIAELQKELVRAEKSKEPAVRKVLALMKKLGVTVADLSKGGATRFGSAKSLNSRERAKAVATSCADST